ncbi:putative microcin-H47 secretion/processing ATP-binding protein MchF [Rhodovastum atsumiense]|uniref:Peptidase domain-containing ABC transporter n=1 Tax=Rhodovastum atsumiense TaxID=504468 RepID=A0A5M6IP04_9PROT|nr:peptidase domain-containing ABC transporter [Rhodovastum atsumiense]KAA5610013.1 peptidase domain-containing ABC transporter [Rhodovastum atsumiense]CAH2603003.1 putative microcin-H47 secretion/processing ATP-binding protein MchF [Rhodovastum atsumiense]
MSIAGDLLDAAILRGGRTPVVRQTEAAECGLACLAMIAAHHGHRIDLAALRRSYNVSLKGMTLLDVVHLARRLHLATRALRLDLDGLSRLRLPCILHWDHSHFVVLTHVGRNSVTINDPATGRRKVPLPEVSRRFTGVALEAWATEGFERKTERARIRVFDLLRRTRGFARAATQILVMSVFLEFAVILVPIVFQLVLDDVIVADDRKLLVTVAIGLGLVLMFRTLVGFVRSWCIAATGARLTLQWKSSLFRHMLDLPLDFFERRHVGDIASRFGSLDAIERTLTTGPVSALVDGVMSVALVAMMWLYEPMLAVIAIGVMGTYALMRMVAYRFYRVANEQAIVTAAQENTHFLETVRGMASVKALTISERRQISWHNYLVDQISAHLRVEKLDIVFGSASTLLFGLDRIIIIVLGAQAVMAGSMTVGMLVAFLAYKDQFSQRVATLLDTLVHISVLSVHGERVADIALTTPEESSRTAPAPVAGQAIAAAPQAALSARGISFRYGDNERPVLSAFDIDVAAGECVAIVGPSGAGKTTLLKILAGLLRPSGGAVLLDGVPVQALGLERYRSQIGCVLQNDRLFAGTIADNIAAFSPAYDPDRIARTARLAAIHEEILRMPMGYETLVGDMGSSLSGGQMQRIVLARALYRNPRILLLDEATSHLDEENERSINAAIRSLTIARVIVAHRRSTIDMADRIVTVWPEGLAAPQRAATDGTMASA